MSVDMTASVLSTHKVEKRFHCRHWSALEGSRQDDDRDTESVTRYILSLKTPCKERAQLTVCPNVSPATFRRCS